MPRNLQERLAEVMHAMGWEHADLMRVSGQSSSVVSQWLGKSSKLIKTIGKIEAAQAIADASGYSALWIAKGILPKRPAATPVTGGQSLAAHPVSEIVANLTLPQAWGEVMNRGKLPVWPAEVTVVMPDGALEPHVKQGDHLTFCACDTADPTSVVVIEKDDGTRWIRRLVMRADGELWGVSTRPDAFQDIPATKIIARVIRRSSQFAGF